MRHSNTSNDENLLVLFLTGFSLEGLNRKATPPPLLPLKLTFITKLLLGLFTHEKPSKIFACGGQHQVTFFLAYMKLFLFYRHGALCPIIQIAEIHSTCT